MDNVIYNGKKALVYSNGKNILLIRNAVKQNLHSRILFDGQESLPDTQENRAMFFTLAGPCARIIA